MIMSYYRFLKRFSRYYENNHSYQEPLYLVIEDLIKKHNNTGLCMEFGVWTGSTITYIANNLPTWDIYGFDSFEGLPEKWTRLDDNKYEKGYFSLNGIQPVVPSNVNLVAGWFNETLPIWINTHCSHQKIDLLHIDCDIYSSTATVLSQLYKIIKPGTIIVFDEFINYSNYDQHEIKAFYEFIEMTNLYFDILYMGGYNLEKTAIIIK